MVYIKIIWGWYHATYKTITQHFTNIFLFGIVSIYFVNNKKRTHKASVFYNAKPIRRHVIITMSALKAWAVKVYVIGGSDFILEVKDMNFVLCVFSICLLLMSLFITSASVYSVLKRVTTYY